MKTCIKCGYKYPDKDFYKNKGGRLNTCKYCCRLNNKVYKDKYRDKLQNDLKRWKEDNREHVEAYMKNYRQEHKDRIKEVNQAWRENNREHHRLIKSICNAQRRAAKKSATVDWSDKKNKEIYKAARMLSLETGIEHHVDHIIPLVHEMVCGLHNEFNLQVLPWYENISKGNNFDEDIV